MNQTSANRILGLDILRFLAVSLVIVRHLEPYVGTAGGQWDLFRVLVEHQQHGGWVGVDLFFVLSGFLVSGLLFREWQQRQTVAVGRFFLRRGLKIYPAFWFFLLAATLLYQTLHQTLDRRGLLVELLFLQNYLPNVFGHTWSLAVEEHFYLLVGAGTWVLLKLYRNSPRNPFESLPVIFLGVASLCLCIRWVSNAAFPLPPESKEVFPSPHLKFFFFGTHSRLDSLLFGVLLSYYWHFRWTARHHRILHQWRVPLIAVGVGLLAPMFFFEPFEPTWIRVWGFILCYLAGGALLLGFLKLFEDNQSELARFIGWLGASSYSVYLWHGVAIRVAGRVVPGHAAAPVLFTLYWVLSHAAAWGLGIAAAKAVEFPVLRLRDRWFPSLTAERRGVVELKRN